MAASSDITAKFIADATQMMKGVDKAVKSLSRVSKAGNKTEKSLAAIGRGVSFLAIAKGVELVGRAFQSVSRQVRAVVGQLQESAKRIDDIAKKARGLGFSFGEFESLGLAASEAGISMDQLFTAISRSTRTLYDAEAGSKTAADAFAKLGLNIEDLRNMSAAERFATILDALSKVENQADRTALAMILFGRSGAALGNLIEGGSDALRETAKWAERVRGDFSDLDAQNVEAMNDAFARVWFSIQKTVDLITAKLAPILTAIADMWNEFIASDAGDKFRENLTDAVIKSVKWAAQYIDSWIAWFKGWSDSMADGASVWQDVASALTTAWEVGEELANVMTLIAKTFKTVFLGVQTAITALLAQLTGVLSNIPGLGFLEEYSKELGKKSEELAQQTVDSARETREALNNLITGGSQEASVSGPLTQAIQAWEERMANAQAESDNKLPEKIAEAVASGSQQLASIDARSTEGVKYILEQQYGKTQTLEQQQLETQKQIAKNTSSQVKVAVGSIV